MSREADEATEAQKALNAVVAESQFSNAEHALEVYTGLYKDYIFGVHKATSAEQDHARAIGLSVSAMREAAGGLLGLIEAARTYADAQDKVNELGAAGQEGNRRVPRRRRGSARAADGTHRDGWGAPGAVAPAGHHIAGCPPGPGAGRASGWADRRRLAEVHPAGIAPVRDELGKLKGGSPYTVKVPVIVTGKRTVSNLQSKLEGLNARYDILVNVHTEPDSPWPDEALKEHLTDPLRSMGFMNIGGRMTLPLHVGVTRHPGHRRRRQHERRPWRAPA